MNANNGNNLIHNDQIVEMLSQAIYRGSAAMKYIPELVRDLILEERWKKRVIRRTGETQYFNSFEEFITSSPLEGLGTDLFTLRRLCANAPDVQELIDQTTTSERLSDQPYFLTYLMKHNPDIAERVQSGEITLRMAAKITGFKQSRPRLHSSDIEDIAEKLAQDFQEAWKDDYKQALAELSRLLAKYAE